MARIRSRLTYANVMATIAVFVALGGSSYAALTVTGKNIKNGSVAWADTRANSLRSLDVQDGGLLVKDFKAGQLPAGATGATGGGGLGGDGGIWESVPLGPENAPDGWRASAVTDTGPAAVYAYVVCLST